MIEKVIERWHRVVAGEQDELDDLLAEDVVFFSPVVFTPQKGKAITRVYLGAAASMFGAGEPVAPGGGGGSFRYVKEVLQGNQAVLEFEAEMDGTYVNGVDIITCNDEGRIIEFKVMIRPLQAIQAVHAAMARLLKALQERAAPSADA